MAKQDSGNTLKKRLHTCLWPTVLEKPGKKFLWSIQMREHHTKPNKIRITRFSLYFSQFKVSNHTVSQKSAILLFRSFHHISFLSRSSLKPLLQRNSTLKNKLKRKISIGILFCPVQVLSWAECELQLWSICFVWHRPTPSCQPTGWSNPVTTMWSMQKCMQTWLKNQHEKAEGHCYLQGR